MAADQDFVGYVVEQLALGDALTCKKMFGEYALYHADKVVALICDNRLFIKPSAASKARAPALPEHPPYPGAKDFIVADELLDDADALRTLFLATSAALPLPKPRASRSTRAKKTPAT